MFNESVFLRDSFYNKTFDLILIRDSIITKCYRPKIDTTKNKIIQEIRNVDQKHRSLFKEMSDTLLKVQKLYDIDNQFWLYSEYLKGNIFTLKNTTDKNLETVFNIIIHSKSLNYQLFFINLYSNKIDFINKYYFAVLIDKYLSYKNNYQLFGTQIDEIKTINSTCIKALPFKLLDSDYVLYYDNYIMNGFNTYKFVKSFQEMKNKNCK